MPPLWHGGRGEIRTPGCLATSPDFESGALVHSATLPQFSRESAFQNLTGIVCFVQFFRASCRVVIKSGKNVISKVEFKNGEKYWFFAILSGMKEKKREW